VAIGHPVLTLNLSGCSVVDVDGILTVLHTYKELRRKGSRFLVVVGTDLAANMLRFMGLDRLIPLFSDETAAAQATQGECLPEPIPTTWREARAETVARWRAIQELLAQLSPEEALRQMTAMTELCQRSETLFQVQPTPGTARCRFCPLFYELGGRPEDTGCGSVLNPIIAAVRDGDREGARARVGALIRMLEEMPLPEEEFTSALPRSLPVTMVPGVG
jgi:hypothetical protein